MSRAGLRAGFERRDFSRSRMLAPMLERMFGECSRLSRDFSAIGSAELDRAAATLRGVRSNARDVLLIVASSVCVARHAWRLIAHLIELPQASLASRDRSHVLDPV